MEEVSGAHREKERRCYIGFERRQNLCNGEMSHASCTVDVKFKLKMLLGRKEATHASCPKFWGSPVNLIDEDI